MLQNPGRKCTFNTLKHNKLHSFLIKTEFFKSNVKKCFETTFVCLKLICISSMLLFGNQLKVIDNRFI